MRTRDGVVVGALVAHDADAAHGEQHGEALPDAVIPVAGFHLGDDDGVGFAQDAESLARDVAEDADGEAGAGKGLALDDFLGQAELRADFADFVLEELRAAARRA